MKSRTGRVERKTSETAVAVRLDLDGSGKAEIATGVPFLDHMLTLFAFHGGFDLAIRARGDLEVDQHHTVEDVGICLGQALKKARGNSSGIRRYGESLLPMDEALAMVAVDVGGRSWLSYTPRGRRIKLGDFNVGLIPQFLKAICDHAGLTLHVRVLDGEDQHHMIEAVFKGLGRALSRALAIQSRRKGTPSTKGKL